jgi:hypothetical protein
MLTIEDLERRRALCQDPQEEVLLELALAVLRDRVLSPEGRPPACPRCGALDSRVKGVKGISRRRECAHCGEVFDTVTVVSELVQTRRPTAFQLASSSYAKSFRERRCN